LKILDVIRPGKSWLAFLGIVAFFIAPEIAALVWPEEIRSYFHRLSLKANDPLLAKAYAQLESLADFSWINFLLGMGFALWFLYEKFPPKGRES